MKPGTAIAFVLGMFVLSVAIGFGICWFFWVRPIELERAKAEADIASLEGKIDTLATQKEEEIREKIRSMDPADVVALYLDADTIERINRDIPDEAQRLMVIFAEFLAIASAGGREDSTGSSGESGR